MSIVCDKCKYFEIDQILLKCKKHGKIFTNGVELNDFSKKCKEKPNDSRF